MNQKIVIIGGVAGGASAAARLRRLCEGCEIRVFERGAYISYANCGLPYHIGGVIPQRKALLLQTPEKMKARFNVDVATHAEVVQILPAEKKVRVHTQEGEAYFETYDKLIIATGSSPVMPPIPGIDSQRIFQVWTLPDTDKIKERLSARGVKHAAVIGGGFIGLEMAENLRALGLEVSIIEMLDQVMAPLDYEMARILHGNIAENGVELILGDGVKAFTETGESVEILLASGRKAAADAVILAMGVRPNGKVAAEAGIAVNARGGIIVDSHMRTSMPDIYAVGDVVEVMDYVDGEPTMIPLAGPANKQGRLVAANLLGGHEEYKGTQGTCIAKVFDYAAAATGHNEKQLQKKGLIKGRDYDTVTIVQKSHAGYYPGATPTVLKAVYAADTGKILGAQIVGKHGVDKRIDTISVAMHFSACVDDLLELETAYAPPFSAAKDPVNMLGFAAQNARRGLVRFADWKAAENKAEGTVLLDVRTAAERGEYGIPETINIPLEELRTRLGELDKSKRYVLFCRIGVRAYVAARIMAAAGFEQVHVYPGGSTLHLMLYGGSSAQ